MNRKLRFRSRPHRPLAIALAFALASGQALALGLGQVEVKSSLYEPLVAEIPVLSSTPGETEALQVRLASPEAFARVGLERPPSLSANLQFSVQENERGQTVIRVTTPTRVNDPFLSFLVEADWGRGRLLREFTVLLDPPTTAPARAATTAPVRETPPAAVERQPAATPATPAAPAPTPRAEAPAARPAPATPAATAPDGDYTVVAGDTLWSIAQRVRPDASVSANQMMVALLRSNPDAFIDENINLLKRGAILRIPDSAQIAAWDAAEAAAVVREQMDAWRGRQAPQPQPAEPEAADTAAAPPRRQAPESRLELVPPRGEQPAEGARSGVEAQSAAGTELRAELARAREDINARDQEIRDLRSRVQELESIQDDSERLLQMKDSELAALQQRLAELEAQRQAEAAAAATDDAAPAEPAAADQAAADTTAADAAAPPPATDDTAAPGEAPPEEEATATDTPVTGTEADQPASTPVTAPLPEQAPSAAEPLPAREGLPWYRNPWLIGGLAALLVGLLVWLFSRRRGRGEAEGTTSRSRGFDSGALAAAVPASGAAAAAPVDRESALLDALAEQPEDLDRHLELARYYYEIGDADAFEGAAEAMYAQVYDPDDLRWKQVVAMGRELLPDHPLFAAAAVGDAGEELPADAAADEAADAAEDWNTANWSRADLEQADSGPGLGQDLEQSDLEQPGLEQTGATAAPGQAVEWEEPRDSGATQQFRLDELQEHAAPEPIIEPTPAAEPEQDFEAAAPAAVPFEYGGDDASATKLELARAYLDMGDVEGARGMLEEVMGEGNAGQRAEARRLLDEIR